MNVSQIYIIISIIALALIAILVILRRKEEQKPLSKLAALAFGFVIAGIILGDERLVGYSLIGIGVVIAIVDLIKKSKNKRRSNIKNKLKIC